MKRRFSDSEPVVKRKLPSLSIVILYCPFSVY